MTHTRFTSSLHVFQVQVSAYYLDCGPILPAFPGQVPCEAPLQLTNNGDLPVEVVCLDLDQRQQRDEEALRGLDR